MREGGGTGERCQRGDREIKLFRSPPEGKERGTELEVERTGGFIRGNPVAETSLGTIYRALPIEGDAEIVLLHRVTRKIAANGPAAELVEKQAEAWSKVRDLHALNLLNLERDQEELFFVTEAKQGRLLSQVLEKCRLEQMGLSPDQAVYVVERAAQAVVSLATHGVKCGCLSPERILLTFEGEVALLPCVFKDLQSVDWSGESPLGPMLKYLPPEAAEGKVADSRADVYSLGTLFFQLLTGEALLPEDGETDVAARIEEARGGIGVYGPLSESLITILKGALVAGTPTSFKNADAMKEALGQVISSGEYGPTTFNMAFLMHSLFREEEKRGTAENDTLLALDRAPYLLELEETRKPLESESEPEPTEPTQPVARPSQPVPPPASEMGKILKDEEDSGASGKKLFVFLGVAVVMVVVIVGTWFAFFRSTGPSKETLAKQALEKKLAEERAKSVARQAELAKRLKAIEDEKNAMEEKLSKATTAREKKRAREALLAARSKLEEQKKKMSPAATSPPAKTAVPEKKSAPKPVKASSPPQPNSGTTKPPEPAKAEKKPPAERKRVVKAGDFVEYWALDVKPKRLNKLRVLFTSVARRHNVHGTIYVACNVSERGEVSDVEVVRPISPDFGMNEACRAATMKLKFSPAMKDGVPVKTHITFPIKLE